MGCGSCHNNIDNSMFSHKKEFMDIARILQEQIISFENFELCKLKVYLIPTKSLPIFLSLIKKYKILENLDTSPSEIKDIIADKDFPEFEFNKEVEIIYNYEQCKILENNKEENEFIIVNDKFIEYMKIKNAKNKKVTIIIDNEKKLNEIKFPDHQISQISQISQNILFKEKSKGIFEFTIFEISAIKNINNISNNNTNFFGSSIIKNNNQILESRKRSVDSNFTWNKLIKEGNIKQDNFFLHNIQQQKNSDLSNKIHSLVDSKSGP
jgi:hypothetical protein